MNTLQTVLPDGEPIFTKARPRTKKGVDTEDDTTFLDPENRLTFREAKAWDREGGNIGVALGCETGDGQVPVVVDGEDPDAIPDAVVEWCNDRALFWWRSFHGGLNWLLLVTPEAYELLKLLHQTKLDLDGDGNHEMELLTNGHALIPPSMVEHGQCSDSKPCDGTGTGSYRLVDVNPGAPEVGVDAVEDLLEMLDLDPAEGSGKSVDGSATSTSRDDDELVDLPDDTEDLIEEAEAKIRKFQTDSRTGGQAFEDYMDLLRGGTADFDDLRKADGTIDKSFVDVRALRLTYGIMRENNTDDNHASDLTYALYDHYVDNQPRAKDGKERKWHKRRDRYKRIQLTDAIEGFDPNIWNRWSRTEKENRRPTGNYAKPTNDVVRAVVDMMTADYSLSLEFYRDHYRLDIRPLRVPPAARVQVGTPPGAGVTRTATSRPSGPCASNAARTKTESVDDRDGTVFTTNPKPRTKEELVDVCQLLDPDNSRKTHGNVIGRLKRDGEVKHAKCPDRPTGQRHVYYTRRDHDPADAKWVKSNGKKREPTPRKVEQDADANNQGVLADGGEPVRENLDSATAGNAHNASTADETDGPPEHNDPTSAPTAGRSRGTATTTGTDGSYTMDTDPDPPQSSIEGTDTAPETPTAVAVESPTETQTPREHTQSVSRSLDTGTTGSEEDNEDTGDATSDKPPPRPSGVRHPESIPVSDGEGSRGSRRSRPAHRLPSLTGQSWVGEGFSQSDTRKFG